VVFLLLGFASTAYAEEFVITVLRTSENSKSVTGELLVNGSFVCHTLELPWQGNISFISSIPSGNYSGKLRYDKDDKWRIELRDVPNRTGVQLHMGNYPTQIQGCVLVGDEVINFENKVVKSASAYRRLRTLFYGSETPNQTPDKEISVHVKYSTGRTKFTTPSGGDWIYDNNGRWVQGSEMLENRESKRDCSHLYITYRGPNMFFRFPLHGGEQQFSTSLNGPWENSGFVYTRSDG